VTVLPDTPFSKIINQKSFIMKKLLVIAGLLLPMFISAQINMNEGVVAYYPFNGNANDVTGNGNDALVLGPVLTADRFGHENAAYYFDGDDDLMTVADNPQLRLSSLSLLLWVNYTEEPTYQRNLISKPAGTGNFDSYVFWYQNDGISGHIGNPYSFGLFSHYVWEPVVNTWYFMAFTYNEHTKIQKIYIDGDLVVSNYTEPDIGWDEHAVMIGAESDSEDTVYFTHGTLDDILILNYALSDDEIAKLYDSYFSLQEHNSDNGFTISPNPCANTTCLRYLIHDIRYLICDLYSIDGRKIYRVIEEEMIPGKHEIEIDVSEIPAGMYFIRMQAGTDVLVRKFIVQ
jgi:hypothetical protein